ncbi:terpene synthase family protein [Streptomyces flavidovirens]|uniref:terpene synthase family protein n=1 Tax=Streptomyces flavidovirens TaxID=67298 RepID=UPI0036ABFAB9
MGATIVGLDAQLKRWRGQLDEVEALMPLALKRLQRTFKHLPIPEAAPALERHLARWALDLGLQPAEAADVLAAARPGTLACYVAPGAPEHVRGLIGMYTALVVTVDDGVIEQGVPVARFARSAIRLLRRGGKLPADTPAHRGLADLRARVISAGAAGLLDELADQLALQFQAFAREQRWLNHGDLPSLSEYLPNRGCTMAVHSLMLLHRALPGLLRPGTRFSPALDNIARSTCSVVGLQNDICGILSDIKHHNPLNVTTVIARECDVSLPEAFHRALPLLANRWHAALRAADDYCAAPGRTPQEAAQARAIVAYAHGLCAWHITAPRFDFA